MTVNIKKVAISVAVLSLALVLSACNLYKTPTGETQTGNQTESQEITEGATTVTFSDSGISPTSLEVKADEAVNWVNNSSKTVEIGSDNHPTHTLNQELTGGEFVLELAPGKSVSVTLTKKGGWGYHNHLSPGQKGTVIVE